MKKLKVSLIAVLFSVFIFTFNVQAQRSVEDAIEWAESQISSMQWYVAPHNFCLRFTANVYGEPNAGYYDAITAWNSEIGIFGNRTTSNEYSTIPRGALVFFEATSANGYSGHIGLYIGRGKMIDAWPIGGVRETEVDNGGNYLGWRWPDGWTNDSPSTTEVNCSLLKSYYKNEFLQHGITDCIEALYYPNEELYFIMSLVDDQNYCLITWFEVDPSQSVPTVLGVFYEHTITNDSGDSGISDDGPDANIKEVELSDQGANNYYHTLRVDPGEAFDVRLKVTNKGDEDIDYFEVFVHVSPDKDFNQRDDYSCGREEEEDDLKDGKSTTKRRTCFAPNNPGIYYVFGYINRVDGENGGEDQNWDNNYSRNDDPEEYGVLVVEDPDPPFVEDLNPPTVGENESEDEDEFVPAIFLLLNIQNQ